jgi:hypothetical protein
MGTPQWFSYTANNTTNRVKFRKANLTNENIKGENTKNSADKIKCNKTI